MGEHEANTSIAIAIEMEPAVTEEDSHTKELETNTANTIAVELAAQDSPTATPCPAAVTPDKRPEANNDKYLCDKATWTSGSHSYCWTHCNGGCPARYAMWDTSGCYSEYGCFLSYEYLCYSANFEGSDTTEHETNKG